MTEKPAFTERQMLDNANFNRKDASQRTRDRICALLEDAAAQADERAERDRLSALGYRNAAAFIGSQSDGVLIETLLDAAQASSNQPEED